jgi:hypothetical protein
MFVLIEFLNHHRALVLYPWLVSTASQVVFGTWRERPARAFHNIHSSSST